MIMMRRTTARLAGLGLVANLIVGGVALADGPGVVGNGREAELIGVLKSNAPLKQKADACRELSRVGTKQSVGPLAELLGDEKLAHMARYALEPIPDPAVDEALEGALGQLKGRPLIGVIGSLGVRRDARAVEPLSRLLKDPDAGVVQAAARALGSIGSMNAVQVLEDALNDATPGNQAAIAEGLFRCAESLTARNERGAAMAIYARLDQPKLPKTVRDGAASKARFLSREAGPTL
jgi:HEAT repeat protein